LDGTHIPAFVHAHMQDKFRGSNANGFLAMDQETCMGDGEDSGSDDSGQINDISGYAKAVDIPSDDSDTLPSNKYRKISPNSADGGENSSSNTCNSAANRSRPRGVKSPSKKASKGKSRLSEASDVIHTTLLSFAKSVAEPPPLPPVPKLDNPLLPAKIGSAGETMQ
jgi:hypothetical protein